MFNLIESAGVNINTESTHTTIQAAERRLRMLKRHNPTTAYWIDQKTSIQVNPQRTATRANSSRVSATRIMPAVTVTPVPA